MQLSEHGRALRWGCVYSKGKRKGWREEGRAGGRQEGRQEGRETRRLKAGKRTKGTPGRKPQEECGFCPQQGFRCEFLVGLEKGIPSSDRQGCVCPAGVR